MATAQIGDFFRWFRYKFWDLQDWWFDFRHRKNTDGYCRCGEIWPCRAIHLKRKSEGKFDG